MKTDNDNTDFGFDIETCACGKNNTCQCNNEEKVIETLIKKEQNAKGDI